MPAKKPIPTWIYITLAILALVPIGAVVYVGKYVVPTLYSAAKTTAASGNDNTIQYRGQTIQLSKAYVDFDEYKNDPNNIAAGETERVQQLVATAPILATYPTREALVTAIMEVEFPGYGMTAFGESPQADGSVLTGFSIEIPRADRERIIVFQLKNGSYRLLDDFVGPSDIMKVRLGSGQLQYYNAGQKLVLTRAVSAK
jgi:hypothetical protein